MDYFFLADKFPTPIVCISNVISALADFKKDDLLMEHEQIIIIIDGNVSVLLVVLFTPKNAQEK